MLNSYIINRSWTFRSKEQFFSGQLVRFLITNLLTLILSLFALAAFERLFVGPVLMELFGTQLDLNKLLIKLPVIVLTLVINFILSRLWVFRQR